MIFTAYRPITDTNGDIVHAKVTDFTEVVNYSYRKSWRDIGSFTLTAPADANGIRLVEPDMLLFVNDTYGVKDSLIVDSVEDNGQTVTLTGTDLKAMMSYRVTLFPKEEIEKGTYGFDARKIIK